MSGTAAMPTAPLRAAIRDLAETFGPRYPRAAEFLERQARLPAASGVYFVRVSAAGCSKISLSM